MSRCTFKNCTARRDGNIHMFKYPVHDTSRCQKWVLNAQKLEFRDLTLSQLRNKVICHHHFRSEYFQNNRANQLTCDAVPTIDGPYCSTDQQPGQNDQNFSFNEMTENKCQENEIEIEEHDVLDNPTIRRIFPDLSVIKKEILEYEEEPKFHPDDKKLNFNAETIEVKPIIYKPIDPIFGVSTKLECEESVTKMSNVMNNSISGTDIVEAPIDTELETHLRFKTFLDSLGDDCYENTDNWFDDPSNTNTHYFSNSTPLNSYDVMSKNTTGRDYKVIRNNIFIFGSKPSTEVKVKLKDISVYLNASKEYCKECHILFPSIHSFKYHTAKNHCTKQKEMNLTKTKKTSIKPNMFKCELCGVKFTNKSNMYRHMKRLHTKSRTIRNRNTIDKQNRSLPDKTKNVKTTELIKINDKTKLTTGNQCYHCTENFETSSALIEHLYAIIGPSKTAKGEHTDGNISKRIEKNNKDTNTVMLSKITCNTCSLDFKNQKDLDEHSRKKHRTNKSTFNKKYYSDEDSCGQLNFAENTNKTFNRDRVKESRSASNSEINECIESDNSEFDCHDIDDDNSTIIEETDDKEISVTNSDNDIQEKKMYQCIICSMYSTYFKCYSSHLKKHNVKITSDIEKTSFNPKCKFCNVKHSRVKSYNNHVSRCHSEKKMMTFENKAYKSVLFECLKCNIYFLSANAAKAHSKHKYIFTEWTCPKCQKSFKITDKQFHMKQHLVSDNIIAYSLSESAQVLCKCTKCAVHFSENEYYHHSTTCGLEPPNAAYCNICDILVNKNDMNLHQRHHIKKEVEFTVVESEFFVNEKMKSTDDIDTKLKIHCRSKFALTFCYKCNCFITEMGSLRKAHLQGNCGSGINPRMCKICGLIFTNRGYVTHKMLHDAFKNLTLQAFYFYDIHTKMQVQVPMPKYPCCNICEVHFLNKVIMKQHVCNQQKYTTCDICKMKYTEAAFSYHMKFHNYKLSKASNKKLVIKYQNDDCTSDVAVNERDNPKRDIPPTDALEYNNDSHEESEFLYTCVSCHVTVHNYDKVVEHCQDHYICKEIKANDSRNYSIEEKFDQSVMFDPFYLRFSNNVWLKHIFVNFSNEQIMKRIADSIYIWECRLKMDVIQPGPANLTLYKCSACRSYIDPGMVFEHVGKTCISSKKYPCSHCGIVFYSSDFCKTHEEVHQRPGIRISSHRLVLYNKTEHQHFIKIMMNSQNRYILYQCRNCEGIVDKLDRNSHQCYFDTLTKCSHCELLFYEQDYNSHVIQHETISSFDSKHIFVVMFGKLGSRKDDMPKSSFSGTIYDLTFYKCQCCGLCLGSENEMSGHTCSDKRKKCICPKCNLCFLKLDAHLQLHEDNVELEYGDFHSNIILFNLPEKETDIVKPMEIEQCSNSQKENIKEDVLKNGTSPNMKETIYKCNCGLHFLEMDSARKHSLNCKLKSKTSKQNCLKCDLLFTPGELFNHLLKHHSKKNVKYDYDIVIV